MKKRDFTYIDLFSGAGGLSLGFENQGFRNIFSIDIEPSFCETYKQNFPSHTLIQQDISVLKETDIQELIKKNPVDVIIGGPPCQGFSMAGSIGRRFIDDPRNHLFKEFARVVSIVQPKAFLMENVARLYTHNSGKTREEIITTFENLGYRVNCQVLNAANFNVPQNRYRTIFIGVKTEQEVVLPEAVIQNPQDYATVKSAIDSLPRLESGEISDIPNHQAMKHSAQMLTKMSYVKDGGDRNSIPEEIRPKSGDIRKYIRYDSSKPSVCITGDMRKVFHYDQNRALTVRELARIQTFPDSFVFKGSLISQQQQVGNSVPPLLAESLAKHIKQYL